MASLIFRMFKTMPFPDSATEEFSNVYRYSVDTAGTTFPRDRALAVIDALLAVEQGVYASTVEFTRCESAEVSVLDGVQDTDIVVDFDPGTVGSANPPDNTTAVAPQNVVMVQERVGPKRWLRKYLHTLSLGFEITENGIAFNYDTTDTSWTDVQLYANRIGRLDFLEPDGSSGAAFLEAGNGTPSSDEMVADPTIRWHDLKY